MKNLLAHISVIIITIFIAVADGLAQCDATWTWADNATPVARWLHTACYDTDRNRMVVYGGRGTGEGETWEWDSATSRWELVATGATINGVDGAMVYDRKRKLSILTGGGGTGTQREVWAWNGVTKQWTRQADLPDRRRGHAMAYDTKKDWIILYGGATDTANERQTLIFNGSSWQLWGSAFTPGVQTSHSMAYDAKRERVVLVESSRGGFMDTYEWSSIDLNWGPANPGTQPGDRYNPAITYDEDRQVVVLVGGDGDDRTYRYDGITWTLENTGGSNGRDQHSLVYDTFSNKTLVFAGTGYSDADPRRDLRGWNGATWTVLSDTYSPSPRSVYGGLTFDSRRNVVVAYSGLRVQSQGNAQNMVGGGPFEWDGIQWRLGVTSGQPAGRFRSALAYDSARGVAVLFGGSTDTRSASIVGDTWEYDGLTWKQFPGTGPGNRQRHCLSFDSRRNRIVLFGGNALGDSDYLGDTWEFDGLEWTRVATTGPVARSDAAMVFDAHRGVTVLFGGYESGQFLSDTWEWDGFSWNQAAVSGPSPRANPAIAYDSRRNLVVVFGGNGANNSILGDLWTYNGSVWRPLLSNLKPSPRTLSGMAYDSSRDRIVLFAGRNVITDGNTAHAQVWELSLACPSDFNCDDFVTGDDFDTFVEAFIAGSPAADFNADGFVTGDDFDEFVEAFIAGC